MRYSEIILERELSNILYHGYKDLNYAIHAFTENKMVGGSVQRFWADGKRRKDDDPTYETSYWMKGVSFTRDIYYAKTWGSVVIAVDKSKISQRYKIIPYNWGFSIPSGNFAKREREEFVVTKMTFDRYQQPDDETRMDIKRFMKPEGEISPLSSFLLGVWVIDDFRNKKNLQIIFDNPKFKGFYSFENTLIYNKSIPSRN